MQVSALEANGTPLVATDGSIYWQLMSESRTHRSTDRGQTWTQACGSGVIKGSRVIELPDNRLAASAEKNIKVSTDHGGRGRRFWNLCHAARLASSMLQRGKPSLFGIGIVGTKFHVTESFATNIKRKPGCALIQFFSVPTTDGDVESPFEIAEAGPNQALIEINFRHDDASPLLRLRDGLPRDRKRQ